jgi:hypothetical protein
MVWMAGDNNLEEFGDKDIAEMKRVGSNDDINVVVQLDRMQDDNTRRYFVRAGGQADDDVVAELGETNTGDPLVATDFFRWAIRNACRSVAGRHLEPWRGIDDTDAQSRHGATGRVARRGNARQKALPVGITALFSRRLRRRRTIAVSPSTTRRGTFDNRS